MKIKPILVEDNNEYQTRRNDAKRCVDVQIYIQMLLPHNDRVFENISFF